MTTKPRLMTAEELFNLPDDHQRHELVRGELRTMAPAGHEHGRIAALLTSSLDHFARRQRLGTVYASETGFKLTSDPDTVRAPDVAFVSRGRLTEVTRDPGYFPGAPDSAIEVVSPCDGQSDVTAKVRDWLTYGCRMVIVVDPGTQSATVYRGFDDIRILDVQGALEGDDVVPGWRLPLAELFGDA
jgi:Uma2 family endonuclease